MKLRKLGQEEHGKTRFLYEEVFSEDDRQFVDYYYDWKIRDSKIFVAEDERGIHAMVHLNPFQVMCCGREYRMHYIVAVATQPEYRHRGLMRGLLEMAEQEMKSAGERYTFLMPASEKIYTPFGYRFFAVQRRGILRGKTVKDNNTMQEERRTSLLQCRPVRPQEYGELAEFANQVLGRQFRLYVKRDAFYYARLCAEQKCQGGDVMVITQRPGSWSEVSGGEKIAGVFCTALEESDTSRGCLQPVLREIILDQDGFEKAQAALQEWIFPREFCKVEGCQPELVLEEDSEVPLFMGKVPGGGSTEILPKPQDIFLNEIV